MVFCVLVLYYCIFFVAIVVNWQMRNAMVPHHQNKAVMQDHKILIISTSTVHSPVAYVARFTVKYKIIVNQIYPITTKKYGCDGIVFPCIQCDRVAHENNCAAVCIGWCGIVVAVKWLRMKKES